MFSIHLQHKKIYWNWSSSEFRSREAEALWEQEEWSTGSVEKISMQCCVLDTVFLLANPQLCGRPVRGLDVRNISGLSLEWMQWTRVENGCVSPVLLFVLLRPNYFSFYLKSVISFQVLILPYFSWIGKRLFLFDTTWN